MEEHGFSQATEQDFTALLRQYWGYDSFRGIQPEIIRSIADGHDTLGLMPTGGGKSLTFQVPALALKGMTLVVTPLIALMKDQVDHLCSRGIRAAAVYSGQQREEMLKILDNSVFGAYKLLYVSPERLGTELFLNKLRRMDVSFITVDEAHCISQWGYDFRPAYLQIAQIRRHLPDAPVLALTATATPDVVRDICRQLVRPGQAAGEAAADGCCGFRVFRMSFARPNLRYVVRRTEDKSAKLVHILRSVPGPAIVYTRSRRGTTDVARMLEQEGISALSYHAGLTNVDKDVRQRAWQEGETRVMVATNAFGMGIDKADVRLVVHMDLPDSVEAYFQEAGRAGRDGRDAFAVLLYNNRDHGKMLRRIPETFPEKEFVGRVYDRLGDFFQLAVGDGFQVTYEFNLERFCALFKFFPVPVVSALQLLTRAGYLDYREEEENNSRLLFLVDRDELYHMRRLPGHGEEIVRTVLRCYGGVFSDYVFIDEQLLALHCGLTVHEVYETLKALTHMRLLHYVPRKDVPRITYLTRRVDMGQVYLPPEVYEERKANYTQRVMAILRYAAEDDECRSRYLLRYFGEEGAADCGRCDVCAARRRQAPRGDALAECVAAQLADGQPRRPADLRYDGFTDAALGEALRRLTEEGRIVLRDGFYVLAPGR